MLSNRRGVAEEAMKEIRTAYLIGILSDRYFWVTIRISNNISPML